MTVMSSVFSTVLVSAVAVMAGCASNVEEDATDRVDPALVGDAEENGIDPKFSVESGSCTTPYGGFKGHLAGYYGYAKNAPAPYYTKKAFGPAPTGAECASWCKNTCGYTGTPTLATFDANGVHQWRCGCR